MFNTATMKDRARRADRQDILHNQNIQAERDPAMFQFGEQPYPELAGLWTHRQWKSVTFPERHVVPDTLTGKALDEQLFEQGYDGVSMENADDEEKRRLLALCLTWDGWSFADEPDLKYPTYEHLGGLLPLDPEEAYRRAYLRSGCSRWPAQAAWAAFQKGGLESSFEQAFSVGAST